MAYIRTKKVRNKKTGKVYEYKQLVEGVWQPSGKVKQVVLAHLGTHETLDAALEVEGQNKVERLKGDGRWSKIYRDFHGRWGDLLQRSPDTSKYWPQAPTIEEVLKRAYPRGWEPGSGKGRKWREAFGLSEDPGENPTLADIGKFIVELDKFWRELDRFTREQNRVREREHYFHVKDYLETRQALEQNEDYSRVEAHEHAARLTLKATPDAAGRYNTLDAALLKRLDKAFSHKG